MHYLYLLHLLLCLETDKVVIFILRKVCCISQKRRNVYFGRPFRNLWELGSRVVNLNTWFRTDMGSRFDSSQTVKAGHGWSRWVLHNSAFVGPLSPLLWENKNESEECQKERDTERMVKDTKASLSTKRTPGSLYNLIIYRWTLVSWVNLI